VKAGEKNLADPSERRKALRINVNWPVTLITSEGTIEGESRNITPSGVFIHCKKRLPENEVYQMIIKLPNGKQIIVKGQMMGPISMGGEDTGVLVDMGFSSSKCRMRPESSQDRHFFWRGGERKPKGSKAVCRPRNSLSSDLAPVCSFMSLHETQLSS
jgi:hypothetical protein